MHVDHPYCEIFHAECWEFRLLCGNLFLETVVFAFVIVKSAQMLYYAVSGLGLFLQETNIIGLRVLNMLGRISTSFQNFVNFSFLP